MQVVTRTETATMPDALERALRLRSRSTPETATRVRTLTAIADGERSGALGHSASLPQLDVVRRGQGHHSRLLTPAFERIDLALPPVSLERSRSLSALAGMANARQQRVQIELANAVKRRSEGEQPAEGSPRTIIAARARTKVNAFDEMLEEIATMFDARLKPSDLEARVKEMEARIARLEAAVQSGDGAHRCHTLT